MQWDPAKTDIPSKGDSSDGHQTLEETRSNSLKQTLFQAESHKGGH